MDDNIIDNLTSIEAKEIMNRVMNKNKELETEIVDLKK